MASSIGRSISIGLSANTKNFAKNLKSAEKNLERFKNGVKAVGAAVATGFAAMTAAALVFGKTAVDAALEEDKAMKQLARTIKNNTKSQKDLSKAAEKTIEKLMYQFNVADDKLRPAFTKLVTATKSVNKSQKLLRLALDVSAGTGKSLDTVVSALSRAYLGNNTALGKLGVGIDKAKLKTMSFDEITKTLSRTFAGQATDAANSYAGSVEGLKIVWSEFQESVGFKILPYLKRMLNYIKSDLLPWLDEVKAGFTGAGQETFSPKLRQIGRAMGFEPGKSAAYTLGEALKTMAESFEKLFKSLSGDGASSSASSLETLAASLTTIANAITAVNNAMSKGKSAWDRLTNWLSNNPISSINPGNITPAVPNFNATGGPTIRNRPYIVGEQGPELFIPSGSGHMRTAKQTAAMAGGGTTIINLNGIVDADSARRSIEQVLRNSARRLGPVDIVGSAL